MSTDLQPAVAPQETTAIEVRSREDLVMLLAEAAELEHNLMCCYLYALFGLKRGETEGLTPAQAAAVTRWRGIIMGVAIEEMTHFALVANLTCAVGARPHFLRPNFPVDPGFHPYDVTIRLAPFDMSTLNHFIFLERPAGAREVDSPAFVAAEPFERGSGIEGGVSPTGQDYRTAGELYRAIRSSLGSLAETLGEGALFSGGVERQVGPDVARLPGLCVVTDLASACSAIEVIVDQGEGAPEQRRGSHYDRFLGIKEEYEALLADDPTFAPSMPIAENPVMRRPVDDTERVFIDNPAAAELVDLANALYGQMLRVLAQAYGRTRPKKADQRLLLDAAIETMQCLVPLAEALARLPASDGHPGVNAGMSFATLRDYAPGIEDEAEFAVLGERFGELAAAASALADTIPSTSGAERLAAIADRLGSRRTSEPTAAIVETPEIAAGRDITVRFEAKRCIHSRFCVLWRPSVFEPNREGNWIHPEAVDAEAIAAVIEACPSGALTYERHDGATPERAPEVNLVYVRENGPLAFRADLSIAGEAAGYRRTLCRCGASGAKPFCDGSHARIGFEATGEPPTRPLVDFERRDGTLDVVPQHDGPLRIDGPVEVVSGTGRTIGRYEQVRLCRCGSSGDKPFCDGSHARVGFETA